MTFAQSSLHCWQAAARLLGWRPAEFWSATPAELACSLGATVPLAEPVLRSTLAQLRAQFPDEDQADGR